MLNIQCYDVEILPNFFSVTFVDLADYLRIFKDCINEKGKPIPLVEKYSVAELRKKLREVKTKQFYITDKDDSQLFPMLGYINEMKRDKVTHLYGFNNLSYDGLMISCLFMYVGIFDDTKTLITKLYETSKHIIELQDNKDAARKDFYLDSLRKFNKPFRDIDLFRIFALNKVGVITDAAGNRTFFGKSLKQTSINIKWYQLLEYNLPPINEEEAQIYWKIPRYNGINIENLNKLIDRWDRYILDDYIPDMMHYNLNDVFIVAEMSRLYSEEIKLRYSVSNSYEVDVLNSSRSDMADKLFIKFYSDFSNLQPWQWRGKKTERTTMSFKKVIFDNIKFKTKELQDFLTDIKTVSITRTSKSEFERKITIGKTIYTVATGGLHSEDKPRVLKSKLEEGGFIYKHFDISSFYPSLLVVYKIAPEHIDKGVFVKLVDYFRTTRIAAKHSKEPLVDGIPKKVVAEALKIVINSIYGKFSYEYGDIYDRMCTLRTTINGQLFILMLCEELELNGIPVVSANTDGIVVKLDYTKEKLFDTITSNWLEYTGLSADSEDYTKYICRDINNYFAEETNGKIDYKGDLNPYMYMENLAKGYNAPIVAKAVVEYFLHDKPVLETFYESTDILDFCKTQNIGRKFKAIYVDTEQHEVQRNVRFYVSNNGGQLFKQSPEMKLNNLCAGNRVTILNTLDDTNINLRDINYNYYYEEALKIIDPIQLGISPQQKGNPLKGIKSGKALLKKYGGGDTLSLFDDLEEDE